MGVLVVCGGAIPAAAAAAAKGEVEAVGLAKVESEGPPPTTKPGLLGLLLLWGSSGRLEDAAAKGGLRRREWSVVEVMEDCSEAVVVAVCCSM